MSYSPCRIEAYTYHELTATRDLITAHSLEARQHEHIPRRDPARVLQMLEFAPNLCIRRRDDGAVHRSEEDAYRHRQDLHRCTHTP